MGTRGGSSSASDSPLVSVAVVTWNHERFIRQAVESVLAQQTSGAVEIIVGDDGSTDNTVSILEALSRDHPDRLTLVLSPVRRGRHANLAAVLARCSGRYIALLDGDDCWTSPRKLELQVTCLEDDPNIAVCAVRIRDVNSKGEPLGGIRPTIPAGRRVLRQLLARRFFAQTSALVFRSGLVNSVPPVLEDDVALVAMCALHGDFMQLDEAMVDYRIHPAGVWTTLPHVAQAEENVSLRRWMLREFGKVFPVEAHEGLARTYRSFARHLRREGRAGAAAGHYAHWIAHRGCALLCRLRQALLGKMIRITRGGVQGARI